MYSQIASNKLHKVIVRSSFRLTGKYNIGATLCIMLLTQILTACPIITAAFECPYARLNPNTTTTINCSDKTNIYDVSWLSAFTQLAVLDYR
jgi:hypothetical protein